MGPLFKGNNAYLLGPQTTAVVFQKNDMLLTNKIGFMQGRLSPIVGGMVQAFPWSAWREEFPAAETAGLSLMEWTLDQDRLYENPLMTTAGQTEIMYLCNRHSIKIPSVTGDCFMQAPFWKDESNNRRLLERDFIEIVRACCKLGVKFIVVPLVDRGAIESRVQEDVLVDFLTSELDFISDADLQIIFESDFNPVELQRFIGRLDPNAFGINYDIGNSAALGYSPGKEISAYGHRILNVHVKDRTIGGGTVPLGAGNADFDTVFRLLADTNYSGNFILQTARAVDSNHIEPLVLYRKMTECWIRRYFPADACDKFEQ